MATKKKATKKKAAKKKATKKKAAPKKATKKKAAPKKKATKKKAAKKKAAKKGGVDKFMKAVEKNSALRDKVKGSIDHIQKVASDHGYKFSHAELRQHLRAQWGMKAAPNYDSSTDTCFFA